jgi:hypothetical protein
MHWQNVRGPDDEGGYAIQHGRALVNEFGIHGKGWGSDESQPNLFTSAYPCLWPYGEGGIESARKVKVSFMQHVRWCLDYYDRRFATHHSFPFVCFGMDHKRQTLRFARLQMQHCNFEADAWIISSIAMEDLKAEQMQEDRN